MERVASSRRHKLLHVRAMSGVPGDDILDSSRQYVPIVGQAGSEGRTVVEGELRLALGLLQGRLEGV